ncbi:hypothetical protein H1C71_029877, partial [Ictidomys tridecemlineatus]
AGRRGPPYPTPSQGDHACVLTLAARLPARLVGHWDVGGGGGTFLAVGGAVKSPLPSDPPAIERCTPKGSAADIAASSAATGLLDLKPPIRNRNQSRGKVSGGRSQTDPGQADRPWALKASVEQVQESPHPAASPAGLRREGLVGWGPG